MTVPGPQWETVVNVGGLGALYLADMPHDVVQRVSMGRESSTPLVHFDQVVGHPDGETNTSASVWVDPYEVLTVHARPEDGR